MKVFIPMGGLFVMDLIFYYAGIYDYSPYLRVPVETICRVGIAALCAWAVVCNRKVKGQLVEKYPRGIGKILAGSVRRPTNIQSTTFSLQ